ncbi:hypothetical protein MMC07_007054 [Pseudocyphellaria aurata]|nr:hypothetical protein [Pseudocyphellaria aurata]
MSSGESSRNLRTNSLQMLEIGTFLGHKGAVWQARLSTDASLAATASADFSAKVWDTHSGECLHTLQHAHIVRTVAFPLQPNPQLLATGGYEKKLRIFDLSRSTSSGTSSASSSPTVPDRINGAPPLAPCYEIGPGVYDHHIKSIVWGPDTNILITASDDKKIRWWDIRSRTVAAVHDLDGPIGSCELDNLSTPSLAVAAGKSAYFFSGTMPGLLLKSVQTSNEIASVALHAEVGKFVTGGSKDPWVRVYDFETEQELDVHKGHHGPIWSVSFAPDGKLYATGSEDGTVKLWKFCSEPYGLWR